MTPKIRPGPLGKSCLTCKRRHKKCDQRQPICKRCEVGRFECLGYNHNRNPTARTIRPEKLHQPTAPEILASSLDPTSLEHEHDGKLAEQSSVEGTSTTSSPLELATPPGLGNTTLDSSFLDNGNKSTHGSQQTHRVEDYLRLFATSTTSRYTNSEIPLLRRIINFQARLPYSPFDHLKAFFDSQPFIEHILERSDRMMDRWYFKPVNYPKKSLRKDIVLRLQKSNYTRCTALIGMEIFESFMAGDTSQTQLHNYWVGYIEESLKRELSLDLTPREIGDLLNDWVHVSLLKLVLLHSSNTYQILRSIAPVFLQLAFSEPTLWSGNRDLTSIPLSTVLASDTHELSYFALIDCTCAMAFGLPQQVEYDTTIYPSSSLNSAHQWAHNAPMEFQLVLADINACRDMSPNARDWRDIENRLLSWQSRPGEYEFTEAWMTVAWYAVQESWRLALLVYLYMAVCNTPSDDSQVQSYIKQLLQVIGTIKQREYSDANLSFLVQYIMVGICARSEAQRKIVRDRLSANSATKLWLMRASDFVPVLDHLWHGAAAGGRPVRWSDYIRSRTAVLPVAL